MKATRKAREVLLKVLEKLLLKPGKNWEEQKILYFKQKELRPGSNVSLHHCYEHSAAHACSCCTDATRSKISPCTKAREEWPSTVECVEQQLAQNLLFKNFFMSRKQGHWNSKVSFSATEVIYTVWPNSQSSHRVETNSKQIMLPFLQTNPSALSGKVKAENRPDSMYDYTLTKLWFQRNHDEIL